MPFAPHPYQCGDACRSDWLTRDILAAYSTTRAPCSRASDAAGCRCAQDASLSSLLLGDHRHLYVQQCPSDCPLLSRYLAILPICETALVRKRALGVSVAVARAVQQWLLLVLVLMRLRVPALVLAQQLVPEPACIHSAQGSTSGELAGPAAVPSLVRFASHVATTDVLKKSQAPAGEHPEQKMRSELQLHAVRSHCWVSVSMERSVRVERHELAKGCRPDPRQVRYAVFVFPHRATQSRARSAVDARMAYAYGVAVPSALVQRHRAVMKVPFDAAELLVALGMSSASPRPSLPRQSILLKASVSRTHPCPTRSHRHRMQRFGHPARAALQQFPWSRQRFECGLGSRCEDAALPFPRSSLSEAVDIMVQIDVSESHVEPATTI